MSEKRTKKDTNLLKLKVALAAGGVTTTLIGAGLLGNQALAQAAQDSSNPATMTNTTSTSSSVSRGLTIDDVVTDLPDLELESIPTVQAPTNLSAQSTQSQFSRPMMSSRSSG